MDLSFILVWVETHLKIFFIIIMVVVQNWGRKVWPCRQFIIMVLINKMPRGNKGNSLRSKFIRYSLIRRWIIWTISNQWVSNNKSLSQADSINTQLSIQQVWTTTILQTILNLWITTPLFQQTPKPQNPKTPCYIILNFYFIIKIIKSKMVKFICILSHFSIGL